jgi:hypothetical protein
MSMSYADDPLLAAGDAAVASTETGQVRLSRAASG